MKKNKLIPLIIIILIISGCDTDKYLDLYPKTNLTEGNFYKTAEQIQQAHNNIYYQLARLYDAHGLPDIYGELLSDNTEIPISAGASQDIFITNFTVTSANGRIQSAWENSYNAIYIINNVIDRLEITDIEIEQPLKDRMIAEAKLIRSLIYFNMVRAWGAIPLVLDKISPAESYNYLRESPDVIYQQIITDLTFAKENLPTHYTGNDVGRVTKFAASAILAKIYLTLNNTNAAQTELDMIINSGQFSLDANNDGTVNAEDFNHIFAPDTKNSKSSILEVQYLSGVNAVNSNHQNAYAPFHVAFNLPGATGAFRGIGVNIPTSNLADEFEEGDPRREISVVPGFTSQITGEFVENPWTMKFYDPDWNNPGQNFEVIRYADILLMYAEVTGNPEYLNMVRSRVGLPLFGSNEYPSELYPTLELAIEHERRVELSFEFHRFFDLVRTGRAIEVLQEMDLPINEDKLLLPIPLYAIDVNNELTQNPGY